MQQVFKSGLGEAPFPPTWRVPGTRMSCERHRELPFEPAQDDAVRRDGTNTERAVFCDRRDADAREPLDEREPRHVRARGALLCPVDAGDLYVIEAHRESRRARRV